MFQPTNKDHLITEKELFYIESKLVRVKSGIR